MIGLSVRRPVAVAMAYLSVGLLGIASWQNIPIELLPDTQLPRLSVEATWQGASPETVEAFLTSPIESEIQQVRGVEKVTSVSFERMGRGVATVDVEFTRDVDMDFARLELVERLSTLQEDLPPTVDPILVQPYTPPEFSDQNRPFLSYTFTGPYTLEALRDYLDEEVIPVLSQVEGVALLRANGGRDRLIEIEVDRDRAAALDLTPGEIAQRIRSLDLVREAGAIREGAREWTITVLNRPGSVAELRQAVLLAGNGQLVRVEDVAFVRDGFEEAFQHYRIDAAPAVSFSLTKELGSNTVRVADRVKEAVAELEGQGLAGMRFILDNDQSKDIRAQLSDLRTRALASAAVIFLVLLIFLRSLKTTAIIFATIAFSILMALNLIYFGGYTLNLLTLMGLALGFGLIVDNSIVVLENVYTRWRAGSAASEAAVEGTRQVVLPILASTATTLIVFVPFVYLQGELRVFYVPLAVVVGFTLLASLIVAFSFIPALAAKVLSTPHGSESQGVSRLGRHARPADGDESGERPPIYVRFYGGLVGGILQFPKTAVLITALCLVGSFTLFDTYVTRGSVWGMGRDQETFIRIQYSLPRGADLERMDELVRFFEDRLSGMPEVERFTTSVQAQNATTRVEFPDSLENTGIPPAIKDQLYAYSLGFSGAEVRVFGFGPSFYGGGGSPPNYSVTILGYNYERVREIAENVGRRLQRQPRIQEVDTNASGGYFDRDKASEYVIRLNRQALDRYAVTVDEFVSRLSSVVRGSTGQNRIKIAGEEIEFEVKMEGNRELDVLALADRIIEGPGGAGIRIGDVATIEPRDVLARIVREDQQYQRLVSYEFRGPRKLGDMIQDSTIAQTAVPPGYTVKEADTWRWSIEEQSQMLLVFLVSVGLIYMVTAALFESLVLPLCVLLTVPMAMIGVFLIFFYTGASFTREAYIGVIMMGGIVVNNAILLVDQINRARRERGLALKKAILTGTLERVRPILMTTATTVIGLLPLVLFSQGADSNIWNALAYALVGGLLSSTLFVLTTTPALYLLLQRRWTFESSG